MMPLTPDPHQTSACRNGSSGCSRWGFSLPPRSCLGWNSSTRSCPHVHHEFIHGQKQEAKQAMWGGSWVVWQVTASAVQMLPQSTC